MATTITTTAATAKNVRLSREAKFFGHFTVFTFALRRSYTDASEDWLKVETSHYRSTASHRDRSVAYVSAEHRDDLSKLTFHFAEAGNGMFKNLVTGELVPVATVAARLRSVRRRA